MGAHGSGDGGRGGCDGAPVTIEEKAKRRIIVLARQVLQECPPGTHGTILRAVGEDLIELAGRPPRSPSGFLRAMAILDEAAAEAGR